jgi:lipopolysaccharide export system permease protein
MWPIFLTSLLVFGSIMVTTKLLTVTEWVVNRGVRLIEVVKLIVYLFPNILLFALPAASLMAVLIGFLRLSSDNEIIALKSSGVSLYQMLPPVIVLCFLGCLFAAFVAVFAVPWGNRSFKDQIFEIVEAGVDVNIRERVFSQLFEDVVFYINNIEPRDGTMRDVFVVDRRDPTVVNTIVAEEGRILKHPESRTITVQFAAGTIFMVTKDFESARTLKFNTYDLNISLDDLMSSSTLREKVPKEMFTDELFECLDKCERQDAEYNEIAIELLERFSMPVAVFFLGLIGAPLGAQIRSRARSLGIFASLTIFVMYYMCFLGMKSMAETGVISPYVGMWVPDLFLAVCSMYLIYRVANERPIRPLRRFSFG